MTDFTSGGIPLMEQSNPQRYLTYNELAWVVNVLQTGVISRSETAPPGSPAIGDAYIPAAPATDEWTDLEDKIVFWFEGVWNVLEPELAQGRGIYVQDEYLSVRWDALGSPPMYVEISGGGTTLSQHEFAVSGDGPYTLPAASSGDFEALYLDGIRMPSANFTVVGDQLTLVDLTSALYERGVIDFSPA